MFRRIFSTGIVIACLVIGGSAIAAEHTSYAPCTPTGSISNFSTTVSQEDYGRVFGDGCEWSGEVCNNCKSKRVVEVVFYDDEDQEVGREKIYDVTSYDDEFSGYVSRIDIEDTPDTSDYLKFEITITCITLEGTEMGTASFESDAVQIVGILAGTANTNCCAVSASIDVTGAYLQGDEVEVYTEWSAEWCDGSDGTVEVIIDVLDENGFLLVSETIVNTYYAGTNNASDSSEHYVTWYTGPGGLNPEDVRGTINVTCLDYDESTHGFATDSDIENLWGVAPKSAAPPFATLPVALTPDGSHYVRIPATVTYTDPDDGVPYWDISGIATFYACPDGEQDHRLGTLTVAYQCTGDTKWYELNSVTLTTNSNCHGVGYTLRYSSQSPTTITIGATGNCLHVPGDEACANSPFTGTKVIDLSQHM